MVKDIERALVRADEIALEAERYGSLGDEEWDKDGGDILEFVWPATIALVRAALLGPCRHSTAEPPGCPLCAALDAWAIAILRP